ncbi:hypothetical protein [Nitrosococcus oceani]|uniref:Transmembrane protein n=2 Tax=Nitrosococcus oceani TaxID=1229 RepID=Q3JB83_NITOC|nr:hypothetical protein [Nitrosococcus oceani]KFI19641.1 hypothetical protein IB75_07450 [Nitrosococcus oceani C-27]ABA57913.1 hypothetical protein Noc_1424 [Nitrosococcus oceani ATCC 19707]EDZ68089.1 hypothetical protein NOC27_1416 [Nitrosococcus oceani AFC27]KFI22505.1 hypothetical protein HW44_08665 [Nitrosococcus oceani]GEM19556.1 hypothetical protein NONS58_09480 [Nitrosococcus oceani]
MGLLPSANPAEFTPNREKFMVLMISAWVMVGAIGIVLSWAFGDDIIGDAMGWVIGGAIGGLATGYALTIVNPSIQSKQVVVLALGWAINLAFFEAIVGAIGDALSIALSWPLGWATVGAIGGWVTGYALTLEPLHLQKKQIPVTALGIALGWTMGGAVAGAMGDPLSWAIGWSIVGAAQGGILLWYLNPSKFTFNA